MAEKLKPSLKEVNPVDGSVFYTEVNKRKGISSVNRAIWCAETVVSQKWPEKILDFNDGRKDFFHDAGNEEIRSSGNGRTAKPGLGNYGDLKPPPTDGVFIFKKESDNPVVDRVEVLTNSISMSENFESAFAVKNGDSPINERNFGEIILDSGNGAVVMDVESPEERLVRVMKENMKKMLNFLQNFSIPQEGVESGE